MLKRLVKYIVFSGLAVNLPAQERLGITNSNYASTSSIFLNPSSSVDCRTYMQLNLVGANAYLMNNLAYIPSYTIWQSLNGTAQDPQPASINLKKFLLLTASAEGPAFVISKRNYGAGFFVRGRAVGTVKRMPYELTDKFLGIGGPVTYPASVDMKNASFSEMSWIEYGVNFGMMIKKNRNDMWTLGGNLKYITGFNIAYANITSLKGTLGPNGIDVQNVDAKMRFNKQAWNSGWGLGLDVGFTYKKMLAAIDNYYANSTQSNCEYVDYRYKLGVSLRDVGFIRFKKGTTKTDVNGAGFFRLNSGDYQSALQTGLNASVNNDPILAVLPTALSVQLDWNFDDNFYLNCTAVKNIVPNGVTGGQGSNLVSFCPRYEFRPFEVAMPLTFQRFLYPQLGFAFRVRTFVLGFDNVFPLFLKKNTYGLNVYFSLGISLFKNKACRTTLHSVASCAPAIKLPKLRKNKPPKQKKPKKRSHF